MIPTIVAMIGEQPSAQSAVKTVLSVILATQDVPRGGAATLYFAGAGFRKDGDLLRAKLCGEASVAALRLEKAIRAEDSSQQRRGLGVIAALLDQWHGLELVENPCPPSSKAAA